MHCHKDPADVESVEGFAEGKLSPEKYILKSITLLTYCCLPERIKFLLNGCHD